MTFKIRFFKKLLHIWDIVFTVVDNIQLQVWTSIYNKYQEYEQQERDLSDSSNLEDWSSWEDVQ